MTDKKLEERNIPGMNRNARFAEVEYAENIGATLKKILRYFAREKAMVVSMLIIVVFGTLCGVYAPSLQSRAVDIIAGEAEGTLLFAVIFMLAVYLLYSLTQFLQNLISAKLSQKIVKRMREELFGKIVDLPIRYLDSHSHGDVMSRMTNDIENISTTVSQSLPSLFSGVLTIIGTVAIMLYYCWQLALLSCATVILTVLATKILSSRVRKYSRRRQMLLGQLNGTVEEMISGYRTVVAYNHQDETADEFCETSDSLTRAGIRTDIFSGVMGPIMNCIGNIGFVIIAAFGGYFAINGLISVGIISAFIVYAKQFSRPINELALVGSTGSGKTTVVNLLMRFYDIDSGEIRINDQNIGGVSRSSLRRDIAIVLQDTVLFSDTVKNNLLFAKADATDEQLGEAVRMSRAEEMLKSLPEGYETVLTASGANISQGQRQLLAIARAFVADPRILILDEATSNVDTRTEKAIQDAMQLVMQNRTSIVIAHRLSTIRDSDVIVVMDRGRIVESGNHEELLAKQGKYYELYMTQFAGYAT